MEDDIRKILDKPTTTVETAGRIFGLSRNTAYQAVKAGEIPSIRIGSRIVVPTAPLRRMLGLLEAA